MLNKDKKNNCINNDIKYIIKSKKYMFSNLNTYFNSILLDKNLTRINFFYHTITYYMCVDIYFVYEKKYTYLKPLKIKIRYC